MRVKVPQTIVTFPSGSDITYTQISTSCDIASQYPTNCDFTTQIRSRLAQMRIYFAIVD